MIRFVCIALCLLALPLAPGGAQQVPPDSVFARAQRLVNEGEGAAGRALIDSLVRATPERSPARADALYWRAQLAPDAAAAQRDFILLIVEYSLTPRAADALLGLAQLEFARGALADARRHLERLVLDHARTPAATEGWFWLGRTRIDSGELAAGCAALDSARAALPATDVERRNQVNFAAQPCRALAAGAVPPSAPSPPPATASRPQWSVQVAAFTARADADRFAATLKRRGYDTRVWDATPNRSRYRVRIGFFATRAEAQALVNKLKSERQDALVVEAESR